MIIFRSHAYEITPQRLSRTPVPPRGGAFKSSTDFTDSFRDFIKKSRLTTAPTIDFRSRKAQGNAGQRHNAVRDLVLDYSFGVAATAKKAALDLARRLGDAMDDRSPFSLLLLVVYKEQAKRRLVVCAFPKDEPFHFSANKTSAQIKILKDAFSKSSSVRKAALYEGTQTNTAFWRGRVVDKQAQAGFDAAADYWVSDFLDSRFSLTGKQGSVLLAKCLKRTYNALEKQSDRDQVSSAIVGLHASQRRRWSLNGFAKEYLADEVKDTFIDQSPKEARSITFTLQKDALEKKLNFRIFRHTDGVVVAAPFGTVGDTVKLSGVQQRRLRYEGTVLEEKISAKPA